MRRVLGCIAVVVLCCAASTAAGEAQPDARVQEAQKAFDEATALDKAGKYPEAVARGEQALALREAVFGSTHLEVASCLHLLGKLQRIQGNFDVRARRAPLRLRDDLGRPRRVGAERTTTRRKDEP
ncbi:tetratricopeptide repeat protein [Hyalangium rubrum]|uniref:Tetratricopeptide repeat protein n=1 Tax=Hyalangium rubrum TaxID=3103134 RepID=A0ABU5H3I0_9BACT|nr:tetratricopeptide repeat protein [Hyalangium sp. s54d21]MDY7227836.1 tetratricopeptide repeat protein [Hyalangium sp. s54d21]